jgi:hypothetical protein
MGERPGPSNDYKALLRGEIEPEEYVRRVKDQVNAKLSKFGALLSAPPRAREKLLPDFTETVAAANAGERAWLALHLDAATEKEWALLAKMLAADLLQLRGADYGMTSGGEKITDEMIERLSAEAEAGYDVDPDSPTARICICQRDGRLTITVRHPECPIHGYPLEVPEDVLAQRRDAAIEKAVAGAEAIVRIFERRETGELPSDLPLIQARQYIALAAEFRLLAKKQKG